jgi:hypothetical protein
MGNNLPLLRRPAGYLVAMGPLPEDAPNYTQRWTPGSSAHHDVGWFAELYAKEIEPATGRSIPLNLPAHLSWRQEPGESPGRFRHCEGLGVQPRA